VVGLEDSADLARSLTLANQVREEFRKNCPVPIVLWVTEAVRQALVREAADLESWATKTYFSLPPSALAQVLATADRWFEQCLDPAVPSVLAGGGPPLSLGGLRPSEVEGALQELRQQGRALDPVLQADLALAEGLNATDPGLHQQESNRTRLSQDYGFLARALLEQGQWEAARTAAQRALVELDGAPAALDWLRGMYRCFWAEAERGLGDLPGAIAVGGAIAQKTPSGGLIHKGIDSGSAAKPI
jgi:hypothetical protein